MRLPEGCEKDRIYQPLKCSVGRSSDGCPGWLVHASTVIFRTFPAPRREQQHYFLATMR
jgi:hypothetical protein